LVTVAARAIAYTAFVPRHRCGANREARTLEFYYHEIDNRVLILRADGGLNSDNAGQFVADLEKLVDAGLTKIIVDCTSMEHISSYGIGMLLRLHKRLARHGGDVKLAAVHSGLVRVLQMARVEQLFELYPDVNRARLAFRPMEQ
jgi:anti-sigma B factor antagonist